MLFLLILGTLASNNAAWGITYYSVDSGNWNSSNKWSLTSGGADCGGCSPSVIDNVVIEGGQTINIASLGASVNNITIGNSSTLTMGNNSDLNINGNFTNNGTFTTSASSIITFQGANTQNITGATIFNNLIINKITANNTIILSNNITIEKTLTLMAGLLVTQNNEISLTGAFNTQLAGAPFGLTNHVVTSANGKFLREDVSISASSTEIVFPISATTTDYAPLSITNNSTSTINYGNITAGVRPAGTAIPPLSAFVNSIWNIAISGSASAIMTFEWNNATNLVGVLPNTTAVKQSNGAPTLVWIPISTTPYVLLAPSITAIVPAGTGTNRDFAVFAVASAIPIPPVPLPQLATPNTNIKFVGINENNPNMVEFSWLPVASAQGYEMRTGTIIGNSMVWKTAIIMGFITNPLLISYQNKNIEYDIMTYYSVKATATTGASNSSWSSPAIMFVSSINDPTTALNTNIENQIKLFPNPTNGFFMLSLEDIYGSLFRDNHITFMLMDMAGKNVLIEKTTQGFPYKMSLESVPSALYYLKIIGKEGTIVKKISKK